MQRARNAYLQTKVTTTSQGDIVVMLYDGAISFLQQAKERIDAKDPAGKGILISKTLDIINELDSTLSMDKGGTLAQNLHSLYIFCNNRLLMANLKMSTEIIDEVLKVLTGLRSAFAEIASRPEAQAAAQQAASALHASAILPSKQRATPVAQAQSLVAPSAALRGHSLYAQRAGVPVEQTSTVVQSEQNATEHKEP